MKAEKKIAFILLAGGESKRMGPANKLLLPLGERSLVQHAAAFLRPRRSSVIVTGHESEKVRGEVQFSGRPCVNNPRYAEGLLTSLQVGISFFPAGTTDAYMILLADQPFLEAHVVAEMEKVFQASPAQSLIVPRFARERGNPVIIDDFYREEILARDQGLEKGAQFLFQKYPERIRWVDFATSRSRRDIDTPEDYTQAQVLWT